MSDESDSEDSESRHIEIQQQAAFGATGELERSDELAETSIRGVLRDDGREEFIEIQGGYPEA